MTTVADFAATTASAVTYKCCPPDFTSSDAVLLPDGTVIHLGIEMPGANVPSPALLAAADQAARFFERAGADRADLGDLEDYGF